MSNDCQGILSMQTPDRHWVRVGLYVGVILCFYLSGARSGGAPLFGDDRVAAEPPPATTTQRRAATVAAEIARLGHDSYLERKEATSRLQAMGLQARAALLEATRSPDPEVRARAQRLVEVIDKVSFEKQLAAFAEDVDGSAGVTLPGWDLYRSILDGDAEDRALFIEMHRNERELMEQAFGDEPGELDKRIQNRALRLSQGIRGGVMLHGQRRRQVSEAAVGSCASMLLVSSQSETRLSDRTALTVAQLPMRPPMMNALTQGPYRSQLRRLIGHWMNTSASNHPGVVNQKLAVILRHSLAEGLPLALRVARGDADIGVQPATYRATAILAVAKTGDESNVSDLRPMLTEETVCQERNSVIEGRRQRIVVQLRDVALAAIIHLQGKKPADFGMLGVRRHEQMVFHLGTLGFSADAQRKKVLKNWREAQQ